MKWISVDTQLPPVGETVLGWIWRIGQPFPVKLDDEGWWIFDTDDNAGAMTEGEVTHWCPIEHPVEVYNDKFFILRINLDGEREARMALLYYAHLIKEDRPEDAKNIEETVKIYDPDLVNALKFQ